MENNLESYLAAIEAQLRDVPAARKAEFMDEVRAHLHAQWEAKRADSFDAATAWLHSMREFGEPDKVGRDLRRQWASSGQMETEGVPLSKWDFARKFGWRLVAVTAIGTAAVTLPESAWEQLSKPSDYVALILAIFGFWIFRFQRQGKQWTIYNIVAYLFAFVLMMEPVAHMQWPAFDMGDLGPPTALGIGLFMIWLWKRDRANRPWQWSALFKSSPVAAEQEYRLSPLIGLAIGTTMGCAGLISIFGLTSALLPCVGTIGGAIIFGWWLQK